MTTMLHTTIKPLGPDDIAAFLALNKAAFSMDWGEQWSDADLLGALELPGVTVFVAQGSGGALIGFLMARTVVDEAEILLVGVLPEERGRGIARALLSDFLTNGRSSSLSKVFLEVRETNQAARSLYDGLDFQAVGTREKYYRRKDGFFASAITLARYLD